jgi:hypothetical protein
MSATQNVIWSASFKKETYVSASYPAHAANFSSGKVNTGTIQSKSVGGSLGGRNLQHEERLVHNTLRDGSAVL